MVKIVCKGSNCAASGCISWLCLNWSTLAPKLLVLFTIRLPSLQSSPFTDRSFAHCSFSGPYFHFVWWLEKITCFALHYCSISFHPLSVRSVLAPVSLRPSLLWLVSSNRPEQASPTVFLHHPCQSFCNRSRAWGMAEGGDCIVVTSSCYGGHYVSFKGTVNIGHALFSVIELLMLSRYL